MPSLTIRTNVSKELIPSDFIFETSKVLTATIGKPEKYICVQVIPDLMMSFAGTTDPCALCDLVSIGKLGVEENKIHTKNIMDHITKCLAIPQDRVYLTFADKERGDVGYNGTTFA